MLNTIQLQTLKAFIIADPVLSLKPMNSDGDFDIAKLINLEVTPSFIVWKSNVSIEEIMRNGMDWARVDNLSVGKARIWDWLSRLGSFDAGKVNVRAGIDAAWVGTAADLAVRSAVYTHCKRPATVLEKILATGTGTDAVPATMSYEGTINYTQVGLARNS